MIKSIIKLAKYYRYAGNIKSLNNIFQEEYFENNGYRNYHDVSENKKFELNEYIKSRSKEIEDKLKKDLKNNSQYISWFYDIIKSKEKNLDDYKEIINIILEFNKIKNSLNLTKEEKNIQNYKSFDELHNFIINFKEENKKYNKVDFPLIYSNSKYNLYKIDKEDKEKFQDLYGKNGYNLAWCVADKNQSYFDDLVKIGYYILWLTKNNKPFALFHDGSHQFKDIHNHELEDDSKEVLDGLLNGCKLTNFASDLKYYKIPLIKYQNPNTNDTELFLESYEKSKLNSDGSIDVNDDVHSLNLKYFVKDGKLTIKFNQVNGEFYCNNLKLISLEGCPKIVNGSFDCSNNKLINLKGCPEYIKNDCHCENNIINTLKYVPEFCFNLYLAYNPIKITDEMKEEFNYPININN